MAPFLKDPQPEGHVTSHIERRKFLATLGGAAVAWPVAARAQQAPLPVIGYLSGGSPKELTYLTSAFREGLNESGHVEGQNVAIEYRWGEGRYDRLPALAADLVHRQVTVLAATTTPGRWQPKGRLRPFRLYLRLAPTRSPLVWSTA